MNDTPITYQNLFVLLTSLGFEQQPPGEAAARPRVFFHEQTDTVLAFGRKARESVTPADLLSTEVHLHARGIVQQPLASLLETMVVNK